MAMRINPRFFSCILLFLAALTLTSCEAANRLFSQQDPKTACPVTEPEWALPPDDPAVLNDPAYGNYYINPDRTLWASAWWSENEDYPLMAGDDGNKIGWFRPAGAELVVTGQRVDGSSPPLEAQIPCCYPTQFQASGLFFPTGGCWEITARAAESSLSFTVWVEEP